MKQFIILTCVILATLVANIFIDAFIVKMKWGSVKSLNHSSRTIIRLIIFSTSAYLLGYSPSIGYVFDFIKSFKNSFIVGLYCFFLFGALFDPLLNIRMGRPWYQKGSSSFTDEFSWMVNKKESLSVARIQLLVEIILAAFFAWLLLI